MWTPRCTKIADGRGLWFCIERDTSPVSYAEVLERWQTDTDFRALFIGLLADAPFSAFRWETPPITSLTAARPFEFVLWNSPTLTRPPDSGAFATHYGDAGAERSIVAFANLGKDALLVVPCPCGPSSAYVNLASFVRHAPEVQKHALWEVVGEAMERRLGAAPVWLSTAGAGVAWLHVRLDDHPKYYVYRPYREDVSPDPL
jgi:hypothetical protein